jgi:hypothetical protein
MTEISFDLSIGIVLRGEIGTGTAEIMAPFPWAVKNGVILRASDYTKGTTRPGLRRTPLCHALPIL